MSSPYHINVSKRYSVARKSATRNAGAMPKKKPRLLLLQTLQTLISYRRFSEQNHVTMIFGWEKQMGVSKNSETPQNGWFIRESPIKNGMIRGEKPTIFGSTPKYQSRHLLPLHHLLVPHCHHMDSQDLT